MDVVLGPNPEPEGPPVNVEAADDVATDELLDRATQWDAAVKNRDEAAADAVLAPDFALELVQPVRSVMKRELWLEILADYVVDEWHVEEQVLSQAEDVAAVLRRVRMPALSDELDAASTDSTHVPPGVGSLDAASSRVEARNAASAGEGAPADREAEAEQ